MADDKAKEWNKLEYIDNISEIRNYIKIRATL